MWDQRYINNTELEVSSQGGFVLSQGVLLKCKIKRAICIDLVRGSKLQAVYFGNNCGLK